MFGLLIKTSSRLSMGVKKAVFSLILCGWAVSTEAQDPSLISWGFNTPSVGANTSATSTSRTVSERVRNSKLQASLFTNTACV